MTGSSHRLILLLLTIIATTAMSNEYECPKKCRCEDPNVISCDGLELEQGRIPLNWPSTLEKIQLRNCSLLHTLNKNCFRRFNSLRELHIQHMPQLDVIDNFAFKGLSKLRLLSITSNYKLHTLSKNSFSAIGNQHSLRIIIKDNAIERIRSSAFRNVNNLRELTVEERCFEVEPHAFVGAEKVDFMTLKGACLIAEGAFLNASRLHNLIITTSSLDLKEKTFTGLEHVNEIQLRENRIGLIERHFLAGINTVGTVILQSNQIGRVEPLAFQQTENLGSLVISYNTIREPLTSVDCLKNDAQKLVVTENTLHCSCEIQWIQHYDEPTLLSENYCGREEAFKALSYYKPIGCPVAVQQQQPVLIWSTTPSYSINNRDVKPLEEPYVKEGLVRWPTNASSKQPIIDPPLLVLFIMLRFILIE